MSEEEVIKYGPGKCMKLSVLAENFKNPTNFYDYDCLYCCKKLSPIPHGYTQWPYVVKNGTESYWHDKFGDPYDWRTESNGYDWRKSHFHVKCWKCNDRIYPTNELLNFFEIDNNATQEILKEALKE